MLIRFHRPFRVRARGGCLATFLGAVALTLIPLGCQKTTSQVELRPQEHISVGQRARNLLLRAAGHEDAVVCCHAIEALVAVAPREGLPHFRAALTSASPLVRFAGCAALGDVQDHGALDRIRTCLRDTNPRVRLAAAYAACRCGETGWAAWLINALNDSPDEKLRAEAAYRLGKLGEKKALKFLRSATTREQSSYVMMHIEAAMAALGDKGKLERLIEYALKSDVITIVFALQTLGELEAPSARQALSYRVHNQSDYIQMRLVAARSLARQGSNAGYDLALQGAAFTAADNATETTRVRSLAALALGDMRNPAALDTLQQLAASGNDPLVQTAACYAICQIAGASPSPWRE